jgi:three-Cys-motif partner protein
MSSNSGGPFPFDAPFSWSLLKLEILEKYADAMATIISGLGLPVCFVDLMAAEGYYRTGDAGSAGRLAEIASRHADAGRDVRVIAIEKNPAAFKRLQANTEHVRDFIDVRQGSWNEQLEPLLEELTGYFVFFFVDPMGVKEIRWEWMEPIVTRTNSELLVNFNSSIAARLAGYVLNGRSGGWGDLLRAVMNGEAWLEGLAAARSENKTPAHLAEAYADLLGTRGGYAVSWSSIAKEGDRGQHKYHMLFASRHMKAFEVMNEIMATQHENLRRERTLADNASKLLPMSSEDYDTERQAALVQQLADSISTDESLRSWRGTIAELRKKAFISRFGEFNFKHYASAVTLLVDRGRATASGDPKRRAGKLPLKAQVELS